jgi:hypothetical protein
MSETAGSADGQGRGGNGVKPVIGETVTTPDGLGVILGYTPRVVRVLVRGIQSWYRWEQVVAQ